MQYVKNAPDELKGVASEEHLSEKCREESTRPKTSFQQSVGRYQGEITPEEMAAKNDQDEDERELEELYNRNLKKWKELTNEVSMEEELRALENAISLRQTERFCDKVCGNGKDDCDEDCSSPCGISKMCCSPDDFPSPCKRCGSCDCVDECCTDKYGLGNNNVIIINSGGNHCEGKQQAGKDCDCDKTQKPRKDSLTKQAFQASKRSKSNRQSAAKSPSEQQGQGSGGGSAVDEYYEYIYGSDSGERKSSEPVNIEIEIDDSESIESETISGSTPASTEYSGSGNKTLTLSDSNEPKESVAKGEGSAEKGDGSAGTNDSNSTQRETVVAQEKMATEETTVVEELEKPKRFVTKAKKKSGEDRLPDNRVMPGSTSLTIERVSGPETGNLAAGDQGIPIKGSPVMTRRSRTEGRASQFLQKPTKERSKTAKKSGESISRLASSSSPAPSSPRVSKVSPPEMDFRKMPEPIIGRRAEVRKVSDSSKTASSIKAPSPQTYTQHNSIGWISYGVQEV